MHFVLRHHRGLLRLAASLRLALDGEILGEWLLGDHHRRSVDTNGTFQPLQPTRDIDHPLDFGVGFAEGPQVGSRTEAVHVLVVLLEAVAQRRITTHDHGWHQLGDAISGGIGVSEHTRGIANRIACLDGAEGDDLRHVVATVLLRRVTDHFIAIARVEVHVDVGHRDTIRIEETLEQQVVLHGIKIGDSQGVRHRATCRRTATRTHANALFTRVTNEVPHDEEVRGESHVADDLQLVGEALHDRLGNLVAPPLRGALAREMFEVRAVVGKARRNRKVGQDVLAELDLGVGSLCNPQRVVTRIRCVAEQLPHLGRGLEVVLLPLELESLRIGDGATGLHAQQRVVCLGVVAVHVVGVVGGEQWRVDLARNLDQVAHGATLVGNTVILQLDEQVVAPEDLLQAGRGALGLVVIVAHKGLQHVSAQAARGGDDALVVPLE